MSKVTRLKSIKAKKQRQAALPQSLERVREHLLTKAGALLSEMLDGADDTLFKIAEQETDTERERYFDAMRELRVQRAGIEAGFRKAAHDLFLDIGVDDDDAGIPARRVDVDSLSLVKDDELETQVALDNLARRARSSCEEGMRAFRHRLEYLLEGRRSVSEANNPLDPRRLAACFADCLERLSLDIRTRLIVLKLFERVVMDEVANLVAFANRILADAGVLPDMVSAPVAPARAPGGGYRGGVSAAGLAQSGGGADSGNEGSAGNGQMFGLLQELLTTLRGGATPAAGAAPTSRPPAPALPPGVMSGGASGVSAADIGAASMAVMHQGVPYVNGAPVRDRPVEALSSGDLFGLLTRLQRLENALESGDEAQLQVDRSVKNELSELLESEHGAEALHALEQVDDDVINLVSMLFDFILDDDGLPPEIKALIGRLQIPLLKVAIADKTFFSNEHHDARSLLNMLARAGCQWDPQQGLADDVYQRINRAVHAIIDNYDDDAALFRELLEEFEAFFSDQRERAGRVEERVREAEEGKARSEHARDVVSECLESRLAGRELPDVTVRLLRQGWQQVLYLCWLRDGEDSDQWRRQAKVVDAVVWSTLPHRDQADLKKLRDLSPRLLRAVRQGLESIQYDGGEIRALSADLKAVHNALLEGLETQRTAVPIVEPQAPPAPAAALPDDHELVVTARHLRIGQWVEMGEGDAARRAKLAANIRNGSKLVFINRRGIKVEEFGAQALARALDSGGVKLIQDDALFDRALEAVIGDLRRMQSRSA